MKQRRKVGIGDTFKTKEGCLVEVLELQGKKSKVLFVDYGNTKIVLNRHLHEGSIKNELYKSVYGVGCLGIGDYSSHDDNLTKTPEFSNWSSLLMRCYCEAHLKKHPNYRNSFVCDEWHNFQNFAKWYHSNFPKNKQGLDIRFELDKDLKQHNVDIKVYSPETCLYLPKEINCFISSLKSTSKLKVESNEYGTYPLHVFSKYVGSFDTREDALNKRFEMIKERAKGLVEKYKYAIDSEVQDMIINYVSENFTKQIN